MKTKTPWLFILFLYIYIFTYKHAYIHRQITKTIVPKPEFSGFGEDSHTNKSTIWGDLGGLVAINCSGILVDGETQLTTLKVAITWELPPTCNSPKRRLVGGPY